MNNSEIFRIFANEFKISNDMKRIEQIKVNQSLIDEQGRVLASVTGIETHDIDHFIMCFLESIPEVSNLSWSAIRVLLWCWKLSCYNKNSNGQNDFVVDQKFRDDIRKQGGNLTDGVIGNGITELCRQGMILKYNRGHYYLNPKYFFKGTLDSRSKLIHQIEYKPLQPNENFDNIIEQ